MSSYQQQRDNFDNQQTKYRLIGLTEHVGSNDSSGHYTAHSFRDGSWYKFDDETVFFDNYYQEYSVVIEPRDPITGEKNSKYK